MRIVSIPYRLATNLQAKVCLYSKKSCFNSLQVGYKHEFIAYTHMGAEQSFNSLQVGYKLSTLYTVQMDRRAVSIPYRLATNLRFNTHNDLLIVQFQFLIGWLQTPDTSVFAPTVVSVSIPYRLATNISKPHERNISWRFQFLIGWLQTPHTSLLVCTVP